MRLLNKTTICFAVLITTLGAHAGVKMNAMCYLQNKEGSQVTPFNPTKSEVSKSKYLQKYKPDVSKDDIQSKYRIASLSKVLTTHWALATLGPEYRFKTKIYLTPGTKETSCNMHIEGDGDPYMGRDILNNVFSQLRTILQKKNCTFVDTISYDENFYIHLDVMKHQSYQGIGWNNPDVLITKSYIDNTFKSYLKIRSKLRYNPDNVGPISKERYRAYLAQVPSSVYSFKSRPLHMIVRDYNKYSFNYPPEVLFLRLGGADAYSSFIRSRLNLGADAVEMYNGSGYPIGAEDSQNKVYNLVSCTALVRITQDMDKILTSYKGSRAFQLADVMAVGGNGETYSTFKGLYASGRYENTMVAKTGTANLAITFGGMLSTKDGDLYFAVLTSPNDGNADNARMLIRDLVGALSSRNTLVKFPYKQTGNMLPFDDQASLVEEKSVTPKTPENTTPEQAPVKIGLKQ